MLHNSSGTLVPQFPLRVARRLGVECAYCHTTFTPTNERGPIPKYCSRSCEGKAYRKRLLDRALMGVTPQ